MKSEPSTFSIDVLEKRPDQKEFWDGVRNYQARNFIRAMQKGDEAFFYHSSCETPGIVGIVTIVSDPTPDKDPQWSGVTVQLKEKFKRTITLPELRAIPELKDLIVLRKGNRLSITPVENNHWKIILKLINGVGINGNQWGQESMGSE